MNIYCRAMDSIVMNDDVNVGREMRIVKRAGWVGDDVFPQVLIS